MGSALRFTFLSLALVCGAAQAQLAYTAKVVNMRAGPAREFPVVAVLPAGYAISVQGCLDDYTWCDVVAANSRGWIYAGNINYFWQNGYAPVIAWGPVIGIAITGFALDDYWSRHYWRSPWYAERHRWADRPWPAPRPHVRPHQPSAPDSRPPHVRPGPPDGRPHRPDGQPWHPGRPGDAAPLQPHRPRPVPPGERPPGVVPGSRPPGVGPVNGPHGGVPPPAQPRPYVAPGIHRPPGVAQPQPRPPRPSGGERPRSLPDNSGRGQPQYP